ncbi:MAG: NBR1-Ig-like domain-containing protein [Caldilineaceae bacterium]
MEIDSKTRNIILAAVAALIVLAIGVVLWLQSRTPEPEAGLVATPQAIRVGQDATATAQATATPAPDNGNTAAAQPNLCTNNAAFAGDVTLPDGAEVQPDTATAKTWRIRNTGTCTWSADYQLRFAGGDQLGGPEAAAIGVEVAPGAEFDATIPLTAPADAGRYQGQWIMADPAGDSFGQVVYYEFVVPGTPAIAYFKASQYWVSPGQQVTLSWDLAKAYNGAFLREVALDGTMGPEQGVVAPGSMVVTPAKTISYDLIARNDQGESMRRLTVMVAAADATATPLPGADQLPVISYFRADRYEITAGEQAILSWDLSGAESAFLIIDGSEEGVTAPSVIAVSPEQTTVYRLVGAQRGG